VGDVSDVLIVGGGIAGSSLAFALASAGRSVTVLESSTEYEDRVLGESVMPLGVKEARNLGVEQVLLDAGAHVAPAWLQYVEGVGEPAMLPLSMMIEGISGTLNLRHPDACQPSSARQRPPAPRLCGTSMTSNSEPDSPSRSPTQPTAREKRTPGWLWEPAGVRQRFAARPVSLSSATIRPTTSPGCSWTGSQGSPTITTSWSARATCCC
jgi:hypothetical protein